MKIKTAELTDAALDWAVATCEGKKHGYAHHLLDADDLNLVSGVAHSLVQRYSPSTNWAQGGPIIEREGISLTQFSDYPQWTAKHPHSICYDGPTPLIAAMRCYVASKLGDEVEVPDELA